MIVNLIFPIGTANNKETRKEFKVVSPCIPIQESHSLKSKNFGVSIMSFPIVFEKNEIGIIG